MSDNPKLAPEVAEAVKKQIHEQPDTLCAYCTNAFWAWDKTKICCQCNALGRLVYLESKNHSRASDAVEWCTGTRRCSGFEPIS